MKPRSARLQDAAKVIVEGSGTLAIQAAVFPFAFARGEVEISWQVFAERAPTSRYTYSESAWTRGSR